METHFARNLKYLRQKFGMEQIDLAHKLGRKSSSTISEWESGKYTPKVGVLSDIANIFGVSMDALMNKDLEEENETLISKVKNICTQLEKPRQKKVLAYARRELDDQQAAVKEPAAIYRLEAHQPTTEVVLLGSASAGTGEILQDEQKETITVTGEVPDHDYALKVVGDSMEPALQDGEIIFIEKSETARNGQIVIANLNGEAFVKKLYYREGRVKLISLNENYEDIVLKEGDDLAIMGVVLL